MPPSSARAASGRRSSAIRCGPNHIRTPGGMCLIRTFYCRAAQTPIPIGSRPSGRTGACRPIACSPRIPICWRRSSPTSCPSAPTRPIASRWRGRRCTPAPAGSGWRRRSRRRWPRPMMLRAAAVGRRRQRGRQPPAGAGSALSRRPADHRGRHARAAREHPRRLQRPPDSHRHARVGRPRQLVRAVGRGADVARRGAAGRASASGSRPHAGAVAGSAAASAASSTTATDIGGRVHIRFANGVDAFVSGGRKSYFIFQFDLIFAHGRVRLGNDVNQVLVTGPSPRYSGFVELTEASWRLDGPGGAPLVSVLADAVRAGAADLPRSTPRSGPSRSASPPCRRARPRASPSPRRRSTRRSSSTASDAPSAPVRRGSWTNVAAAASNRADFRIEFHASLRFTPGPRRRIGPLAPARRGALDRGRRLRVPAGQRARRGAGAGAGRGGGRRDRVRLDRRVDAVPPGARPPVARRRSAGDRGAAERRKARAGSTAAAARSKRSKRR